MRKLITLALLLIAGVASAAIQSRYYRVKSYNDKYLTENVSNHTLVCSDLRDGNYTQVWYLNVNGSNVTLKNALTERYVQSQNNASYQFTTEATPFSFTVGEDNSTYTFKNHNNGWWDGGLHCDAGLNVVFWDVTDAKSKWTVEAVEMDEAALAAQQAALTEVSTEKLGYIFTTSACTELKSPYNSYSDEDLRTALSALSMSTTVQDMAIKVKNNSWATYSGWNKTEKTFRIADYKAYSSGDRWTSILGCKHHLGRLSNPTGIWVNSGDIIQVYVGTIPGGQSVALEVAGYGQASGSTYSLHEGMNSLLMASSGNCFVFYEVDNTTNGGTPYKLMSNYADVTVHIEGGTVQGYFDLTKGDTDSDWTQMKTYLLTDAENKPAVCLKTDKHVMNLGITRLINALNGSSITAMLQVWRDLAQWEDELMGRSDSNGGQSRYGQYCNNIFSVTALPGSDGSPHASTYGTFYYDYSDPLIFNANALLTVADNLWCIAHEQGHNRQNPINMVGNTEMSNNVFANLAIYNQGRYSSRTASIQDVFNDYLDGISWPERVQRANNSVGNYNAQILHLNWSLYMFFHLNGNDPDFFPRLFDALRADPMTSTAGEDKLTPASTDYLKYYVKCCEVSGYDLTDFFASYGFFMLPPEQTTSKTYNGVTTNRYQNFKDYGIYNLYVTQEMIDAAKAQVAAMNNLKKCNITFIEDRVKAPLATYEGHAEGEKKAINYPDAPVASFGAVGEMGQYTDFDVTPSAYTYNISGRGNVTVSGTGAVGIIVYDNSGNIVGFYNTSTFRLPASAFDENGLKSGYSIKAAAGDGTMATATYDSSVEVNEFPKTGVWYVLVTPLREGRFTQSNGAGQGMNGTVLTTPTAAMQWQFVERDGEPETFDIINRADNSYISPVPGDGNQLSTSSAQPAAGWKVGNAQTEGYHIIYSGETQLHQGNYGDNYKTLSYGYWYSSYNTTDDGCQFAIEEVNELSSAALDELAGLDISVSENAADDLTTGQWYVMFDRGANHGYLYENVSSHTLYNTATKPANGEISADNAKYLVRLIDAGDGKYYIQTGYGNYFWTFKQSTNVQVSAYQLEKVTIAKINGTAGHFYLQASNNVILDANAITYGDATVVGYDNNAPTSTDGNNDWAFYPVTLTRAVTLNAVGDKSYATLYLPYDVTTNGATKAYYITEVAGGYAQLTATSNEGKEIPANTAVVLINSEKATSTTLTVANGLAQQVSESTNLLKGTLTPMELDLSQSSPYYSLGVIDKIGFYKFNDGNSTTITLGANKAYLEYTAPAGVKGFALDFGGADGIEETKGLSTLDARGSTIYDMSGRQVGNRKLTKGIYIVNGRKVVVK